jgi:hypothetical protein
MKIAALTLSIFTILLSPYAESQDSLLINRRDTLPVKKNILNEKQHWQAFIVPAGMITYGVVALNSNSLRSIDLWIKDEVWEDDPHHLAHIDDLLQYAPAAAVYGLNLAGVKGKHNFRDRSLIYLLSFAIKGVSTGVIKQISNSWRPDSTTKHSFPSGHTSTAFAAAEFMRMEYKDVSVWYGVAAYADATMTGLLRLYNNRHWLRDIIAGAGVGIISTRLAYLIYPFVSKILFKKKSGNSVVLPFYHDRQLGISLVCGFK